jgi:hypothetical protein
MYRNMLPSSFEHDYNWTLVLTLPFFCMWTHMGWRNHVLFNFTFIFRYTVGGNTENASQNYFMLPLKLFLRGDFLGSFGDAQTYNYLKTWPCVYHIDAVFCSDQTRKSRWDLFETNLLTPTLSSLSFLGIMHVPFLCGCPYGYGIL